MSDLRLRSILVASDLREGADVILASAFALADRTGAELHVVHAAEFLTVPYSAISAADDYQRRVHEAREALNEQVRRSLPEGVHPASQLVREDTAARAILARAQEVEADLILIGPARPRAFRSPILGNTADRLLGSARMPVLVLPGATPLEVRRVVVPIDLADPARGAIDLGLLWAGSLALRDSATGAAAAEVRVVYVIPRRYQDEDSTFSDVVVGPQLQLEIEDAQQRVGPLEVMVRADTVWGDAPAEEIVRYVESQATDLLVLGTHGYGALRRALIGSVASKVVRAAPSPILLVPPAMWVPDA
jgi:nucleotide-binding universal stress UspA family protein